MCITTRVGKFDDTKPVSIRMSAELEEELSKIATTVQRSRNSAILLLLQRGIAAFRADGLLLDTNTGSRVIGMTAPAQADKAKPSVKAKNNK